MGGHGGLNILPQKRWNVYNRENRFKVAQDEAKAKEAEDAEEERHQQAEREYRHQTLMQRAGKRTLGLEGQEESAVQGELPAPEHGAASADGLPSALLQQGKGGAAGPLEHINFWKEEEISNLNAQHPEVEAAQREEARKRGKADFYTMDPKFDERFQLGYQMAGEQPWYAKKPVPTAREVSEADPLIQGNQALAKQLGRKPSSTQNKPVDGAPCLPDALPGPSLGIFPSLGPDPLASIAQRKQSSRKGSSSSSSSSSSSDRSDDSSSSSSSGSSSDSSDDESSDSSRSWKSHRHKKRSRSSSSKKKAAKRSDSRKRKHRSKDRWKSSKRHKSGKKDKKKREIELTKKPRKSIEQLRAERLSRETVERDKARLTLMGALDGGISQPAREGYNSGYGFAAQIKKHRR